MKINKDLVESLLMVSFISLVLIGTTDFTDPTTKNIAMGITGVLTVVMAILRVKAGRQPHEPDEYYN